MSEKNDDIERLSKELTGEELAEKVEAREVSIAELMEVEEIRRRITRYVIERDIEEHRDVYERLAEI